MMKLGDGAVTSFSRKQKLNAKSSTQTELIGVEDALLQALWTSYFVEEQGYLLNDNIVMQDNMSAIKLENNGKASSSQKTKHINMRHFFINDKIDIREVSVKYCNTDRTYTDILTMPVQGVAFKKVLAVLMNCDEDYFELNEDEEVVMSTVDALKSSCASKKSRATNK